MVARQTLSTPTIFTEIMGASVSSAGSYPDKGDADYCQLNLSAIFNDAYVNSVFEQLPVFEITASNDKDSADLPRSHADVESAQDIKFKKLIAIIGSDGLNDNAKGGSKWIIGPQTEGKSAFEERNRKRLRLLLRIYQVSACLPCLQHGSLSNDFFYRHTTTC